MTSSSARSPLRDPQPGQGADVCHRRHSCPRARHRRDDSHLQRGQCRGAAAVALQRPLPPRDAVGRQSRKEPRPRAGVAGEFHGRPRARPGLHRRRGVVAARGHASKSGPRTPAGQYGRSERQLPDGHGRAAGPRRRLSGRRLLLARAELSSSATVSGSPASRRTPRLSARRSV